MGVRSICLGAWEKRVEGREKNKTSRIWGDDVVWEVGSVINGKERAPVSHPRCFLPSCPPHLPPSVVLLLPFLPLERLKWGQPLAVLTGPSRGVQHGAGKVLFLARGCPPPAMYSTKCRAPRLRENGRQSYRFHITKHPDWSNVIPVAGTPSLALLPGVPRRLLLARRLPRTAAAHHLRRCSTWPQSSRIGNPIFRSACAVSAEPGIGWPPQRLSCLSPCRAPRRACR